MRGAEWYKGWGSSGTRDLGMILFRSSQVGKPLGYGLMGKEMRVFGILCWVLPHAELDKKYHVNINNCTYIYICIIYTYMHTHTHTRAYIT